MRAIFKCRIFLKVEESLLFVLNLLYDEYLMNREFDHGELFNDENNDILNVEYSLGTHWYFVL